MRLPRIPQLQSALVFTLMALAALSCGGGGGEAPPVGPMNEAPAFTTHPASQTVTAGASVRFTVAASGQPMPSFTWERSADGATWTVISGATSATYSYTAQASDHGERFRAKASNGIGTPATSNMATLRVGSAPMLTLTLSSGVDLELVEIPAGPFLMGRYVDELDSNPTEGTQHTVTIGQPFYMGRFEVTQGQWVAITGSNPSYFSVAGGGSSTDELMRPVERVSWDMICTSGASPSFLGALNKATASTRPAGMAFRLPTEAEWEYACRAGAPTPTRFYWGDDADSSLIDTYAWYWGNTGHHVDDFGTHPVGTKTANAFGLHDMSGNVEEWCEDDYHWSYDDTGTNALGGGTIPTRPDDGGAWIDAGNRSTYRMLRGGSWESSTHFCRSVSRDYFSPDYGDLSLGFRVVLSAPKTSGR